MRAVRAALPLATTLVVVGWAAVASTQPVPTPVAPEAPTMAEWVAVLAGLALVPLVAVMVTSFVKVAVVLAILRAAIGAQGVPSGQIILGMALILTGFIMAPVGAAMYREGTAAAEEMAPDGAEEGSQRERDPLTRWLHLGSAAAGPLVEFLSRHTHQEDAALFVELSARNQPPPAEALAPDNLMVLVPAFVVSELKEAFYIGFLLFIPFLVIDLVIANILLSLGMHMLAPSAVSLPFKLLLFVLVDGWVLLVRGLVESYQL